MKRREPMNNLWMIRGACAAGAFIHSARLRIRCFVPIAY